MNFACKHQNEICHICNFLWHQLTELIKYQPTNLSEDKYRFILYFTHYNDNTIRII